MAGYKKGSKEYERFIRKRNLQLGRTKRLREEGLSCAEIAEKLKVGESTVRTYFAMIDQAEANKNNL